MEWSGVEGREKRRGGGEGEERVGYDVEWSGVEGRESGEEYT